MTEGDVRGSDAAFRGEQGPKTQHQTREHAPASAGATRATARRTTAGLARVFGATARGLALDAAAGLARAAEVGAATATGRDIGPCTLVVHVLILSDEQGHPLTTADRLTPSLDLARRVFAQQAGIRIRVAGIDTLTDPAPTTALDPHANRGLLLDEIAGRTALYRRRSPRREALSVSGDPVTVVVVRTISGRTTGCSLGMTADWVICRVSLFDPAQPRAYDETVLAHELGHALNLPHDRDRGNLMYPISSPPGEIRGTALRRWQAALMQANRHTVPPTRG